MSDKPEQLDEIEQLVRRLDEEPDELHVDVTPAVQRLSELGWPAARAVLPALDSSERLTRLRAQRVVEGVVVRHHGWRPGRGYPDPVSGEAQTRALLGANGSYDADGTPEQRRRSVDQWRVWLERESEDDAHAE